MNALASLLALAAACLAALVVFELRPQEAAFSFPARSPSALPASATPAVPAALETNLGPLADTLLARPLFSQTRRPPTAASSASAPPAAIPLPRMTGILIDGPRRSAIFASPGGSADGRPTIVIEGGRIGPFTVQTIEPQHVIVIGPEGRRTVRTSFDPMLQPPAAPSPPGLAVPRFPGIAAPGGSPIIFPPTAPSAGYGQPQSAGAAR